MAATAALIVSAVLSTLHNRFNNDCLHTGSIALLLCRPVAGAQRPINNEED